MQLSDEQKREFFHQGYVILKGVVSEELVANARARIKAASREDNLSDATELTDLVNRSEVTPILQEVMGQFDPPSHVQVGVTPIRQPGDHFTPLGYQDKELPYYGHTLHAEGLFTGAIPQEPLQGDPAEIYRQILAGSFVVRAEEVVCSMRDLLLRIIC